MAMLIAANRKRNDDFQMPGLQLTFLTKSGGTVIAMALVFYK